MACGSCGKQRQLAQQQAQAPNGKKAKYTVILPDGSTESFDDYLEATTRRRATNGTLTTST